MCYGFTKTVVAGLLLCQLPARTVSQYPHNNLAGGDVMHDIRSSKDRIQTNKKNNSCTYCKSIHTYHEIVRLSVISFMEKFLSTLSSIWNSFQNPKLWQVSFGPITWGRRGNTETPSSTATKTLPIWMPLPKYSKAPGGAENLYSLWSNLLGWSFTKKDLPRIKNVHKTWKLMKIEQQSFELENLLRKSKKKTNFAHLVGSGILFYFHLENSRCCWFPSTWNL